MGDVDRVPYHTVYNILYHHIDIYRYFQAAMCGAVELYWFIHRDVSNRQSNHIDIKKGGQRDTSQFNTIQFSSTKAQHDHKVVNSKTLAYKH